MQGLPACATAHIQARVGNLLWRSISKVRKSHEAGGVTVLQRTWAQFTAPTLWLTIICNSNPGGSDTLFCSPRALGMLNGHTQRQIHF